MTSCYYTFERTTPFKLLYIWTELKGAVSNRSIPFMLDTDRKGAAVAISRLLSVYNLSIEELPLIGRPATHLEAKDMLYIGIQAVHNADITTAVSWFSTALTMFEPDPGTRSEIFQELARAHYLVRLNYPENKRSSTWQLCRDWWHQKLSLWHFTVLPMITMRSNWCTIIFSELWTIWFIVVIFLCNKVFVKETIQLCFIV